MFGKIFYTCILTITLAAFSPITMIAQESNLDIGVVAGYRTGQSLQIGYRFSEHTHLDVILPAQKLFTSGIEPSSFYSQMILSCDYDLFNSRFYYSPGFGAAIGSGNRTRITLFPEYGALLRMGLGVNLARDISVELSPIIGLNKITPGVIDENLHFEIQLALRLFL